MIHHFRGSVLECEINGDVLCQQKSGTAWLVNLEKGDTKRQLIPEVDFNCENTTKALGTLNKQVSSNHGSHWSPRKKKKERKKWKEKKKLKIVL